MQQGFIHMFFEYLQPQSSPLHMQLNNHLAHINIISETETDKLSKTDQEATEIRQKTKKKKRVKNRPFHG